MSSLRFSSFLPALCVTVACSESPARTAADSQGAHVREVVAAGGVVDSILPIAEQLRRFRAGFTGHADTLSSASASIDDLVGRWARALTANDSAALKGMVLTMAEFAWLYYPDSKLSRPPYESPPALLWWQFVTTSNEGARAAFTRFGGRPLRVQQVACKEPALVEGANRLHEQCMLTFTSGGGKRQDARLFGTIIERAGLFKFVGLSNAL